MRKRRKYFGSVYAKIYVGDKSVNIHFDAKEREKVVTLARALL